MNFAHILKIAHEYDFPAVKTFALNHLENKKDIQLSQRIDLYRQYHVDKKLIIPLFIELLLRDEIEWLNDEEIDDIGFDVAKYLFRARERLWRSGVPGTPEWNERNAKKALSTSIGKFNVFVASGW